MLAAGLILAVGILGYFLLQSGAVNVVTGAVSSFMGKLTAQQIAQYAATAGFSDDDLVTATAIALAESGGDPNIEGDNGTSYGLWQIHWTVHPEFDKSQLKDPQYNANAAYQLYVNRDGFNDWSTFTVKNKNGVLPYTNFLNDAQNGVDGVSA